MMSMNFGDTAILNIHGADSCCIISGIRKNKAIKLMQIVGLSEEKCGIL